MKNKIAIGLFSFVLFMLLLRAETVPQTQTVLKSYFNPTGARPGTNAYNELIDTTFWYINVIYTNAVQARQAAQQAAASYQGAQEIVFTGISTNVTATITNGYNIASVSTALSTNSILGGTFRTVILRVDFSTPLQGTNYIVAASAPGASKSVYWIGFNNENTSGNWGFYYYTNNYSLLNNNSVSFSNSVSRFYVRLYSGQAWTDINGAKIKLVVQ